MADLAWTDDEPREVGYSDSMCDVPARSTDYRYVLGYNEAEKYKAQNQKSEENLKYDLLIDTLRGLGVVGSQLGHVKNLLTDYRLAVRMQTRYEDSE